MKTGPLWRISVTTSKDAEEAVAALLERLFGQTATIYSPADAKVSIATVYSSRLADRVGAKRKALDAGLQFLVGCELTIEPAVVNIRKVPREDWSESWKKNFRTIRIGSALVIRPSWDQGRAPKHAAVVQLDPGLSFGTGQHPTTEFCLEQLVCSKMDGAPQSFLDVGTGSGILAIAAVKLGYHPVRAIDHDRAAVRIAKENARKNRVSDQMEIVWSDITRPKKRIPAGFDLICANLTDDLLIGAQRNILTQLKPATGKLVLAGILRSQFSTVQKSYASAGLILQSTRVEGEWQSGRFGRRIID